MSSGETLPRVLVNPKLHRRPGNESCFSRTNSVTKESKKHICPPIDSSKEKTNLSSISSSTLSERYLANGDAAISPLSPADGLSPACTAMANACSHDHDYLSPDQHRVHEPSTVGRHMSELSLNLDFSDDAITRSKPDMKTIIRIPVPPKPDAQKSPRDGRFIREVSLRHHRRIVKPVVDNADTKKPQEHKQAGESSCIFVSTSRTAQPRRVRSRTSRKKSKKVVDENQLLSKEKPSSFSKRSTSATFSDSSKGSLSENIETDKDFDVTQDKLTVEWRNMVKQFESKYEDSACLSGDNFSEDEIGQPLGYSTPGRKDTKKERLIPSPRPSVTPCPPCPSRKSTRQTLNSKSTDSDNVCCSKGAKDDSAYFSFNSSQSSLQPRSSAGTPTIRTITLDQSRPSTGQRSACSSARPPSGGKRMADASLSSTSSGASSDDDSLCSSIASQTNEENCPQQAVATSTERKAIFSSEDGSKSSATDVFRKEHKAVRLRKGKKVIIKPHMHPVPPRKPKNSLPMHQRALPISFFQEPNRFSPSPYNILPPVMPLFRQPLNEDMNDIRPVTPPEQQKPPEEVLPSHNNTSKRVVIKMGDTDLLHRLFDAVDPQPQLTGRRIKRGRPKRPPRILPSPKLTLDNNPCIMQSITEKLFPNLSIEKRQNKQKQIRNQVVAGMMLGSDRTLLDDSDLSSSAVNFSELGSHEKDVSQFGILTFNNSSSYDDDVSEHRMDVSSPVQLAQRQEVLALPQLPLAQDYSQMLSDVVAGL